MQIALKAEECGGIIRYEPVCHLDLSTRKKAQDRFRMYQAKGTICSTFYSDCVWNLSDELHRYTLDFHIDSETYRRNAQKWTGCTSGCYQECMKAYIIFRLGDVSLNYLRSLTLRMRRVAEITLEEVEKLFCSEQTLLVDFLSLLPGNNDLKDAVIESLNDQGWRNNQHKPRLLKKFSTYLKFNKKLDDFWTTAEDQEKKFYFPIYFWWKLTAILPLRVTEFLVTPRDCIHYSDERYLISIRRTKLKKDNVKLAYTLETDYSIRTYEIPEWLFGEIKSYQKATENDPYLPALRTLLVPSTACPAGYFSYVQLEHRLNRFCAEIAGIGNDMIRAGDTRHLAMINLILSGGSPVICKELAGHESIDISSNYYANLSSIIESVVYEQCHSQSGETDIAGNFNLMTDLPKEKTRVDNGWCDVLGIEQGDVSECLKCFNREGQIGKCTDCIHFYPESPGFRMELERNSKKEVDQDAQYLMQMIELVRKGMGCEEDIGTALLRLQGSGFRYASRLAKGYWGEQFGTAQEK